MSVSFIACELTVFLFQIIIPLLFSSQCQDDFTDDDVSSQAYFFDDFNFNMEDFVTVDEIGDDAGDTSPDHRSSSSSRRSSRGTRESQSSNVSSPTKGVSTKSSKVSKNSPSSSSSSSASSSSSSKFAKGSINSSPSTSVSKDSAELIKCSSKSLSTSRLSKTSVSSPQSAKTPSSLGPNQQQSNTKFPDKASAETVEASVKTVLHREKVKTAESAMASFDHRVSGKGSAAKNDESETKIEISSEMHPPAHGTAFQIKSQSPKNDDTLKEEKTIKEKKEGDVDKQTKNEVDDGENYQILDSLDEQMNDEDQEGHSEIHLPGTEDDDGNSLPEEGFQVLDSVEDEVKICIEENSEIKIGTSFQVLDSITEEKEATNQEDSFVQDNASTEKKLFKEDVTQAVEDTAAKYQEVNKEDSLQVLETGSKQTLNGREDENKRKQTEKEVKGKMLTAQSSEDVEKSNRYIQSQDQSLESHDKKDLDNDINEQETFEILDSIDDQMEMEENGPKLETPSNVRPATTETDSETDTKEKRTQKGEATTRKDNRPSRRSSTRTSTLKSEEKEKSPKKPDRTVKKYETRTTADSTTRVSKTCKNINEEMVFKIVDAVEEEPGEGADTTERSARRRSVRGKREDKMALDITEMSEKAVGGKDATYKILDSVDDETGNDKPTITTRSTRGRRERTVNKDASKDKIKNEDTPTRRRHTPARESQEKTPKKEETASPKETSPTKKCDILREVSEEDAMFEILDSVEDEVTDDQPATEAKGKRGRPKKYVKPTKEDSVTLNNSNKDCLDKVADLEEVTYQILDSVEEVVDNKPPTEQSVSVRKEISENDDQQIKKSTSLSGAPKTEEEEEEPMYQIVDSLEEDQVQEESVATEVSSRGRKENIKTKACPKVEATTEKPTCGTIVVEASVQGTIRTESFYENIDHLTNINNDSTQSDTATSGENMTHKSHRKQDTLATVSTLVNLDEVSEEEEDYPDDTAEKEELRRKQAATKVNQAKVREKGQGERKTRGREERERRCSSRGGNDGGATRRMKEVREKEEDLEEDTKELVTLDEVGADEGGEEKLAEGQEWDADIMGGELQSLVTLDEIVEEEEGKVELSTLEASPTCKDDVSADSLNPEVMFRFPHADFI